MPALVRPFARLAPTVRRPVVTTAAVVVWAAWGVLAAGLLGFVAYFGRNCPYMDEWGCLDALCGDVPALSWAWQPHCEHRYPLPRLVYLGLFRLVPDLRLIMAVNAVLLAASAAVVLLTAARVRGRTARADLFVPLAVLHGGQWEQLFMAYQICFTIPAFLAAVLFGLTFGRPGPLGWARAAGITALLVALPGCGGAGMMLAAGAIVPLTAFAILSGSRGPSALLLVGIAGAVGELAVGAAAYPGSNFGHMPRTPGGLIGFAARLTAMTFGPAAEWLWPAGFIVVAVVGVSAVVAAVRTGQWVAVAEAFAVPAGACLLLAGLTWGRGWMSREVAFMSRYGLLMAPVGVAAYLLALRFGSRRLATVGPALFALMAAVSWVPNTVAGVTPADRVSRQMDAFAADLRDGLPHDLLAERFDWQFRLNDDGVGDNFARAARLGSTPFRGAGPTRPTRSTRLTIPPTSPDGVVRVDLKPGSRAVAVRLRGRYVPATGPLADFHVQVVSDAPREERFTLPTNGRGIVVVRVDGRTSRVEFAPGCRKGGRFEVLRLELIEAD